MSDNSHKIASLMGQICQQTLWQSPLIEDKYSDDKLRFSTRVGSGRATYCKYDTSNNALQITFGRKMITSKFQSAEVIQWLSYRELIRRQYHKGDSSLLNVLAHTICHEFAHALQHLHRQVYRGSIHNTEFYKHLDNIYETGYAEKVKDSLKNLCDSHCISLDYIQTNQACSEPLADLRIDSKIQFSYQNKTQNAVIIKVNKKSYVVESKGLLRTTVWRIPKAIATPVNGK